MQPQIDGKKYSLVLKNLETVIFLILGLNNNHCQSYCLKIMFCN